MESARKAHVLAAERLHQVLPGATLFVSLRNPVTRAWSMYLHMWRKGDLPPDRSFREACATAPEILGDGEYFRCLRPWRELFPAERLHALVHKDFVLIGTRSTGPFMMTRDEWLDAIQRREVEAIDIEVEDATVVKDVMIGTVHARWRLKYLGRIIEDCVVLTDVWVKDDGRWQAIRRHSTPAPPGSGNLRGE